MSYIFFMCSDLQEEYIETKHLTIYPKFLQKSFFCAENIAKYSSFDCLVIAYIQDIFKITNITFANVSWQLFDKGGCLPCYS